jgi:hypothetical protein
VSTPYSRRPDWVAATREFLISVRHRPDSDLPRYGEVAQVYGGIARAVAPVLNAVARDCAAAGEPDLSALVVLSSIGLPGRLNGQALDPQDSSARSAWLAELERVRRHRWRDAVPRGDADGSHQARRVECPRCGLAGLPILYG